MMTVTLNEAEREILYRQPPGTGSDGGYQSLLVSLQRALNDANGEITITDAQLERIPKYAFNYGNGGWEDRLTGIFSRTLGPRLDGNL